MVTQTSGGRRDRGPWARIVLVVLGCIGFLAATGVGQSRPAAVPPTSAVLVSSRALAESTMLTADDVRTLRVASSAVTAALNGEVSSVIGRRLLVRVPAGTPLAPAMLRVPPPLEPPTRLVPLTIAADRIAGQTQVGDQIDVVAARPTPGGGPGGRVEVVASGRLVSLTSHRTLATADPGGGGGGDLVMLLACDEVAVMRLLWAQSYAHALTAVARPERARALPSDGGPGA